MFNSGDSPVMFYRPRLGYYTNASKNAKFYHETCEATSYDWWHFVQKIDGKVVFNDYYYSIATGYHQRGMRELLTALKIKVDLRVNRRESLNKFSSLSEFLPELYKNVFDLEAQLKYRKLGKPQYAHTSIKEYLAEIAKVRKLGGKLSKVKIAEIKKASFAAEQKRAETIKANRKAGALKAAAARKIVKNSWLDMRETNNTNTENV